jgi:hypothetical protein
MAEDGRKIFPAAVSNPGLPLVVSIDVAEPRPRQYLEDVMRYMLLIYGEEPTGAPDPAELEQVMNEYWAYEQAVGEAGVKQASDALQPTSTATTVRVKDGERVVTDGPFAETREVLGGFYLIDVPDLDAALDWAARCPGAKHGSVEVRPVMEFDAPA